MSSKCIKVVFLITTCMFAHPAYAGWWNDLVKTYDRLMGDYKKLPFVPDVKADLTDHVIQKAIDGIFYYLAKEEAAICKDPVKQSTDLLRRVFGAN